MAHDLFAALYAALVVPRLSVLLSHWNSLPCQLFHFTQPVRAASLLRAYAFLTAVLLLFSFICSKLYYTALVFLPFGSAFIFKMLTSPFQVIMSSCSVGPAHCSFEGVLIRLPYCKWDLLGNRFMARTRIRMDIGDSPGLVGYRSTKSTNNRVQILYDVSRQNACSAIHALWTFFPSFWSRDLDSLGWNWTEFLGIGWPFDAFIKFFGHSTATLGSSYFSLLLFDN